ncbi:BMC domain-containing protein [Anoxynatronum sibiricum]|uniref:BMC domain-containing protein n=1 Tax=Anoxynatronum sibiricum TaxID=210623 RepID=UPI003CCCB3FA
MNSALGLIEAIGLTSAMTAVDAACKAADIKFIGYEKIIGAGAAISVTVHFAGEVAAVQAGVAAGVAAALKSGRVLSHHVIPRPHEEVDKLIEWFRQEKKDSLQSPPAGDPTKGDKAEAVKNQRTKTK